MTRNEQYKIYKYHIFYPVTKCVLSGRGFKVSAKDFYAANQTEGNEKGL
jgi:hypothetical protein